MARALEHGGPVLCVMPELCVFTLQEQARQELGQDELHEVAHWHAYLLLQLKPLQPDFIVDCDSTGTYMKVTPARVHVTHSIMAGKMFGHGAAGNPYSDTPTANLLLSACDHGAVSAESRCLAYSDNCDTCPRQV